MIKRLAIITSHPIQYNAPLFQLLAERHELEPKVFYTWGQAEKGPKYDPGFGKKVEWDIPLLKGYNYEFVENVAPDPGTHHFKGIDNPSLITRMREWKPDAILIFGWSFKSHLSALRYFHNKVPIIFRGDSTQLDNHSIIKKILRKIFLKWVYSMVDASLYVGTENKLYYLQHGLKEKQLIFAPHAIDNQRFLDKDGQYSEEAIEWRKKLNIPEGELVFLYAGKLEEVKAPFLMLEAFSRVSGPGIHMVIVGNGVLEHQIKQQAAQLNIHFVDFQNQSKMPVVYRLGDVFLLPSKSETWGLAINEAMACSKPIIVSDRCGCAVDLVKEGVNGFVFRSGDVDGLTRAFNEFIRRRELIPEMGKRSYDIIREWNYTVICEALEKVVSRKVIS